MARPTKKGLDYFPFDVGFFEDIKIKRLKSRYGTDGICLYLYILTQIYTEGYYIEIKNEEDFYDDIKDTLLIEEGKARQIINYCSERSMIVIIIPEEIGEQTSVQGVKVLTAPGIQMRYAQAMKKRKKSLANVKGEYWILSEKEEAELNAFYKSQSETDYFSNNDSFSANNGDNSEINSTNKIKENETTLVSKKVDKDKKDNHTAHARASYQEIIDSPVYAFDERVKEEIWNFIQHCIANGRTPTNNRLHDLCTKLILQYRPTDISGMVDALKTAVSKGYFDIKDSEGWIERASRVAKKQEEEKQ